MTSPSSDAGPCQRDGCVYRQCCYQLMKRLRAMHVEPVLPPWSLGLWSWPCLLCLDDHPMVGPAVVVERKWNHPFCCLVLPCFSIFEVSGASYRVTAFGLSR